MPIIQSIVVWDHAYGPFLTTRCSLRFLPHIYGRQLSEVGMLIEHVVQVNPYSIIASVPVCPAKELKRTVCLMDE
jgi:hypothetical protein